MLCWRTVTKTLCSGKKVGGWPDISFSHISSLDDLFTIYSLTARIGIIYAGKGKKGNKKEEKKVRWITPLYLHDDYIIQW